MSKNRVSHQECLVTAATIAVLAATIGVAIWPILKILRPSVAVSTWSEPPGLRLTVST